MNIKSLDIIVYHAKVSQVVTASFAQIPARSMALIRVEDEAGNIGWGEIWGNFPEPTIRYRAELAAWLLPKHLIGVQIDEPGKFCDELRSKLHLFRVQADERGPTISIVAALSQALWDLKAKAAGVPLRTLLNPQSASSIPCYASGLNPDDCVEIVTRCRESGYRAYKLKIGFGDDIDMGNIETLKRDMVDGEQLFVDANQRWDLSDAMDKAIDLETMGIGWLEEPMPADRPASEWQILHSSSKQLLAGGENFYTRPEFDEAGWLSFVQPDVGKWGGIEGCLEVGRAMVESGKTYCPHWLAGGVGLMHSANLLAAVGGDGLLEIDSNENPLRTNLIDDSAVTDGQFMLLDAPGIGVDPQTCGIESYEQQRWHFD